MLLSRDDFREGVFDRDSHKCVICDAPAQDAHHILERRLWGDGGYYLDNGSSLCSKCHLEAEMTTLSCTEIREAIDIKPILPDHLYGDLNYDKWGNVIQTNGSRLKGELFFDESVQKILGKGGVLDLFTDRIKYPRTYHLPWSPGLHDDDRMMKNCDVLQGLEVVVTEKMDGENTTMYHDYIHARSIDSRNHESRGWVKNFHGQIGYNIPVGWRVCGENSYAKHSISYDNLLSYFLGFSIWNECNECLSWDDTLEYFELLDVLPVPAVYRGPFDEQAIKEATQCITSNRDIHEGYVVRLTKSFPMSQFRFCVGKYVRKDHIMTTPHWMHGKRMVTNKLMEA